MTDTLLRRGKQRRPPIEAELRLGEWGPRGSARAEVDGRPALVDRGVPGELVAARLIPRRRELRGSVQRVIEASPDRVAAPCPYYAQGCGGCQWQHLDYAAQLAAKQDLVDGEMEAAGVRARVQQVHAMSHPWRYRRTAAIALGWEAGFRPIGRRGIVELADCLISHPAIGSLSAGLNRLLRAGQLPNYHGKVWLDCTVVGSASDPALQVLVQGLQGLTLESHPELPAAAETIASLPDVTSVAYRHRSGEPRPLLGDLFARIEVAGRWMYLPAGSFFQTNLDMLAVLLARVRRAVGEQAGRAADIYGGVGTFGLWLAEQAGSVVVVELDPLAIQAAEKTARDWGLDNVSFVSRHAEKALPDLADLDVAVVDPPRSGLGEVTIGALLAHPPSLLCYVSCAPASLARDLSALQAGGYRVESLEIFDFYPHTYHVESLAILTR